MANNNRDEALLRLGDLRISQLSEVFPLVPPSILASVLTRGFLLDESLDEQVLYLLEQLIEEDEDPNHKDRGALVEPPRVLASIEVLDEQQSEQGSDSLPWKAKKRKLPMAVIPVVQPHEEELNELQHEFRAKTTVTPSEGNVLKKLKGDGSKKKAKTKKKTKKIKGGAEDESLDETEDDPTGGRTLLRGKRKGVSDHDWENYKLNYLDRAQDRFLEYGESFQRQTSLRSHEQIHARFPVGFPVTLKRDYVSNSVRPGRRLNHLRYYMMLAYPSATRADMQLLADGLTKDPINKKDDLLYTLINLSTAWLFTVEKELFPGDFHMSADHEALQSRMVELSQGIPGDTPEEKEHDPTYDGTYAKNSRDKREYLPKFLPSFVGPCRALFFFCFDSKQPCLRANDIFVTAKKGHRMTSNQLDQLFSARHLQFLHCMRCMHSDAEQMSYMTSATTTDNNTAPLKMGNGANGVLMPALVRALLSDDGLDLQVREKDLSLYHLHHTRDQCECTRFLSRDMDAIFPDVALQEFREAKMKQAKDYDHGIDSDDSDGDDLDLSNPDWENEVKDDFVYKFSPMIATRGVVHHSEQIGSRTLFILDLDVSIPVDHPDYRRIELTRDIGTLLAQWVMTVRFNRYPFATKWSLLKESTDGKDHHQPAAQAKIVVLEEEDTEEEKKEEEMAAEPVLVTEGDEIGEAKEKELTFDAFAPASCVRQRSITSEDMLLAAEANPYYQRIRLRAFRDLNNQQITAACGMKCAEEPDFALTPYQVRLLHWMIYQESQSSVRAQMLQLEDMVSYSPFGAIKDPCNAKVINPEMEPITAYPVPSTVHMFSQGSFDVRLVPHLKIKPWVAPALDTPNPDLIVPGTEEDVLDKEVTTTHHLRSGGVLGAEMRLGKCHAKGTPILMYDGSVKLVEDVIPGDRLMGDDSTPRNVIDIARGQEKMYKIEQLDHGDSYVVNESHILSLKMMHHRMVRDNKERGGTEMIWWERKPIPHRCVRTFYINWHNRQSVQSFRQAESSFLRETDINDVLDISIKEYLELPYETRFFLRGYKSACVEFPPYSLDACKPSLLNPYLTGVLLSDCKSVYAVGLSSHVKRDLSNRLMERYGEHDGKFIPHDYMVASVTERYDFLSGFLEGHLGTSRKNSVIFVVLRDEESSLVPSLVYIIRSLGLVAVVKKERDYIGLFIIGYLSCILKRNAFMDDFAVYDLFDEDIRYRVYERSHTRIDVVEQSVDDYYGFEIDGNHRYLLGDFTVTHNTILTVALISYQDDQLRQEKESQKLVEIKDNDKDNGKKPKKVVKTKIKRWRDEIVIGGLSMKEIEKAEIAPTLILAPLNCILQSWLPAIKKYAPHLTVLNLSNKKHRAEAKDVSQQTVDIVICPTSLLPAAEGEGALWPKYHRIVVDEAHTFAKPTSHCFKSLQKIRSRIFWMLTGTPFGGGTVGVGVMGHMINEAFGTLMPLASYRHLDDPKSKHGRAWKINAAAFARFVQTAVVVVRTTQQHVQQQTTKREHSCHIHWIDDTAFPAFRVQYKAIINSAVDLKVMHGSYTTADARYCRRLRMFCSSFLDIVRMLEAEHVRRGNDGFEKFNPNDLMKEDQVHPLLVDRDVQAQDDGRRGQQGKQRLAAERRRRRREQLQQLVPIGGVVGDDHQQQNPQQEAPRADPNHVALPEVQVILEGDGRKGEFVRKDSECCICLDQLVPDNIHLLGCNHALCSGCMIELFAPANRHQAHTYYGPKCPMCSVEANLRSVKRVIWRSDVVARQKALKEMEEEIARQEAAKKAAKEKEEEQKIIELVQEAILLEEEEKKEADEETAALAEERKKAKEKEQEIRDNNGGVEDTLTMTTTRQHPKMVYLLQHLRSLRRVHKEAEDAKKVPVAKRKINKLLIFSDMKETLQAVWHLLRTEADFKDVVMRISAEYTPQRREKVFLEFTDERNPSEILLLPFKQGSVGIDLSCADRIIFMEPFTDKATELQAINRMYHIKKEHPMHIDYLVIRNTIEENILKEFPSDLQRTEIARMAAEAEAVAQQHRPVVAVQGADDSYSRRAYELRMMLAGLNTKTDGEKRNMAWLLSKELKQRLPGIY